MDKIWLKHYESGVPAEINPDSYASLVTIFEESCRKFKDKPALANFGGVISYEQWATFSRHFAAYLQQALRHKKGDRLAIMLPNILQHPVAMLGAMQAGLVIVNINPLYTVPELIHQLRDAGATTIIVLANFAHTVQAALPQTNIKNVIITEIGDLLSFPKSVIMNFAVKYLKKMVPAYFMPQALSFKKILHTGKLLNLQPVLLDGEDIAYLQYTGGTTGTAKGAMLTHRNMVANVLQAAAWVSPKLREREEIIITALPLYHIFSLTANCLMFLKYGALNVLITNPRDISGFIAELAKYQVTAFTGVNTLFNALLNHEKFSTLNFSALKFTLGGGMPVQSAVAEKWQQVTGKPLLQAYG